MAVYTDVAAEELAEFLRGYDIGELLSYKGIAEGVENSNFLMHTSKGAFILTLYEKRVAEDDLPYFLSLMAHLAERADSVQAGLRDFIARELDHLDARWPADLPLGVIHGDLFPDNVFFLGDKLSGLIDFPFSCNDILAYDVAICLNAWCFEPDHSFNVTKARALLNAYGRARSLSEAEQNALPLLARGAALRFLLTRLVDFLNVPSGALVKPKDPLEYVRKLRFQQGVTGLNDYGVTPAGCVV